jgi:hypothetical protein
MLLAAGFKAKAASSPGSFNLRKSQAVETVKNASCYMKTDKKIT